jgi:TatD DNase family protein
MRWPRKARLPLAKIPRDRIVTETVGPFAQVENCTLLPWDADRAITATSDLFGRLVSEARACLLNNIRSLLGAQPAYFDQPLIHM